MFFLRSAMLNQRQVFSLLLSCFFPFGIEKWFFDDLGGDGQRRMFDAHLDENIGADGGKIWFDGGEGDVAFENGRETAAGGVTDLLESAAIFA